MRTQFMMVARAGNHPHHLMTREPHAQCEGISIVVPPTHAEMGTTRILVHVYCIPHTHSQTCGNEHITNRYHLSTTPTYPTKVPGRTRSRAAQPSVTPCERSTQTKPQTLATQAVKVSTARYTHVRVTVGHHKARTRQKPQGVRKVLACLRVPPRGSAAPAIKSP